MVKTEMAVANAAKVIGRCSSNQNAAKEHEEEEERDSFSGSREGGREGVGSEALFLPRVGSGIFKLELPPEQRRIWPSRTRERVERRVSEWMEWRGRRRRRRLGNL